MNEIAINTPNIIKGVREYKFSTSNYSDSAPFAFISSYIEMIAGKTYTVGVRCKEVDEGKCVWGRLNGTTHGKVTFGLFKDKGYSVYTIEEGSGAMYHTDGIVSVVKTYYNGMMCLTITPSVSGKYYIRIDITAISSESKPWVRNLYDFTAVEGSAINIIAPITAQAEHTQELMKSDEVKLSWSDTVRYDLPMGSNITVNGKTYYLYEPHQPSTTDGYEWKYTPNFQSEIFRLGKTPFMLYTLENNAVKSVESDWNFTGDKEAIKIALEDAILRGTGLSYTVEIDEGIDKALIMSFSNVDIITALNNICKDWECEWWYDNNVITITKRYVVGDVIAVTDGVEVQGTTTKNQNTFYNRFYVFGSDRNIPQDYNGAQATQVVNKRLTLDPTKHSGGYIDLPKFDSEGNVLVDANGDYITDESVSSGMIFSKVVTIEDVYPKSDLSVQSFCTRTKYMRDDNDNVVYLDDSKTTPDTYKVYYITLVDGVGDLFTINPSTYDKDKNPNGSLIKGKELSLHMKSGALSGREFKLIYHEQSETLKGDDGVSVTIPAHCFEVVFIQDNTVVVPNTNIAPKVGDKAIIFNIRMPQMYIDSAYRELEEKALLAIYEESRDKNAYTVKSNQVYFAENNPQFVIGSNTLYTVGGRDLVTRVTKLVTKLDRAFEQTITFCKELSKGSISTIIEAIESTEKHVTEVSVKDDRAVQEATRKAYKAQQELKDMVFDTDGYFKDGNIKPETIETLMLSVGAMSTNFALQNVLFEANYNQNANSFNVLSNSGKLIHYAIDPDNIKTWNVSASTRTDLTSSTAYYVYAQCAVNGTTCNIVLSTEQYKYNALVDSNGVYMFLIGTLSSVMSGANKSYRILSLTYGATTINGGQLKTGRISSADGGTYFDLDTGVISGQISFKGSSDYTDILGDIADVESVAISANETAISANSTANTAKNTANTAKSTADSANSKVDNLQIGGRNYILNSANSVTYSADNTGSWRFGISEKLANIPSGTDMYLTFDCVNTITSGKLRLRCRIAGRGSSIDTNLGDYSAANAGEGTQRIAVKCKGVYTGQVFYVENTSAVGGITISNVKLELGNKPTDWTPAPEDVDEAIAEAQAQADAMEYLKEAMQQGSTDINGGLVLTNVVQLKDNGNDVVAGVCGRDDVRFWSGGTLAEALQGLANFIVNSQGVLKAIGAILKNAIIESGNEGAKIEMSEGSLKLVNASGIGTELTYQQMTNITSAISNMSGGSSGSKTVSSTGAYLNSQTNFTEQQVGYTAINKVQSVDISYNNTNEYSATLVSANTRAGVLKFSNNLTITPKTPALADAIFVQGNGTFSRDFIWNAKFEVYNANGVVYSTSATSTTSTVTIPINGVNINLTPNTAYYMRVYATLIQRVNVTGTSLSNNVWAARVYLNTDTSSNQTASATISSNVTFTTNYNVYNNKFYSNGLLFSQGTDKYFALCAKPTTNDDILAQWRNGNAIYRIKKNVGLLYNLNGGSSYYLANPVVLSFRVIYNSSTGKYNASGTYNPKGLSLIFSGSGTALTVSHSYGKALNVSVIVHGQRTYATLQAETTSSFTLNLGGNIDATITCIDPTGY